MEYKNLTLKEQEILSTWVGSGEIAVYDLPQSIWVGLDSMGPARSSLTDTLFEEIPNVLSQFTLTMVNNDLGLVAATNGPPIEGRDILSALDGSLNPRAFAVTEGGGVIINYPNKDLESRIIVPQNELDDLREIEEYVKKDTFMKVMSEDTKLDGNGAPIRTPYKTNIVLTIPENYGTLNLRLYNKGVNISDFGWVDWHDKELVNRILDYAKNNFDRAREDLGLSKTIGPVIVKRPNRRVYQPTQHVVDGQLLLPWSKYSGVGVGSKDLGPEFDLDDSIYIADGIVDKTMGEGNTVLGGSERSMVKNGDKKVRMAFNVTMDNQLPRLEYVEGVKILNIGSGAKALEAIDFLYNNLYKPQEAQMLRAA